MEKIVRNTADRAAQWRGYHRQYMRRWRQLHPEYVKRDNEQRKVRYKKQRILRKIDRMAGSQHNRPHAKPNTREAS